MVFPRQNIYGPVLFKIKTNFLLNDNLDVWITKDNPVYWGARHKSSDHYFQGIEEIEYLWNSIIETQKK
jgi:hypothetical protein